MVPLLRSPAARASLIVATCCSFASPAIAAPSRDEESATARGGEVMRTRRVVVERFRGVEAKAVRQAVVAALEAEVTLDVVSERLLDKHKDINDGSPEGYAALSDRLDLLAFVRGKVGGGKGGYLLALTVIKGKNGKSLGTLAFHGRTIAELKASLAETLLSEVEPMLKRAAADDGAAAPAVVAEARPEPETKPEPKAEPEPKPEPASEAEPQSEPASRTGTCPWLEIDAGGGVAQRWFNFVEEERGALRGYRLLYAPFGVVRATYRPFAHTACGVSSGFGVRLGYERTFGITSDLGGQPLDTLAFAFESQVEFKYPIGIFSVTPRTGFVYRQFQVAGNYTPDPKYKLIALGLDGGVRAGMFLAELGWAAHFVLGAGSLQGADWFPNAGGFGWQADARIGAAALPWLDAFAIGEYESYSFDLDPTPPGTYPNGIAQGSYDRYLRLGVGVRFYVPGRLAK